MKDKDVIEGNKIIEWNFLIAKFMGWTYPHIEAFKRDIVFHESHNYDTRWDKLMPVVEKIKSLGFKFIIGDSNRVTVYNKDYDWRNGSTDDSMIECVWHGVTQFIKWYNQTKQQQQ